jgi:DNA polymerase-4
MQERAVIHLNVADFAVAVERTTDSRLKGRPVIIAPGGGVRAVVYDMSDEAYQNGVRKGMALNRAMRCCRDASVLPPHHDRYERAMADLLKCALPYSPLIESTDHKGHLFVDVTGTNKLFGPPPDVALRIRKAMRASMGFDPIWSVAPNKLVAKIATRLVKPIGEYIVCPGEEEDFLSPVPVNLIPGIEPADLKKLQEFNMTCAGHVAAWSVDQLEVVFDRRSRDLHDAVRGIDLSPVSPAGCRHPAVRYDHEFGDHTNDTDMVKSALYRLIEKAGALLRKQRLAARQIRLIIDYSDGRRTTRQAPARPATANDFSLFVAAELALERAWTRRTRIRSICLQCDRLTFPPAQLELFADPKTEKTGNLFYALDMVRSKFGQSAICMGRTLLASSPESDNDTP